MFTLKAIIMVAALAAPLEFEHDDMFATEAECLAAAQRDIPLLVQELRADPQLKLTDKDVKVEVYCNAVGTK